MTTARKLEQPLNPSLLTPLQMGAVRKLFALGNLSSLLHSTQLLMSQTFKTTASEEFLAFASRQLGKSWWLLVEAIETLVKFPGSRILYYAPTKDKLRDIINDNIEPMQQWAPEGLIRRHKSSDRWFIGGKKDKKTGKYTGASELRLCVLERSHVDRNRGINARVPKGELGICIEEPCFVSSDDFKYAWESVIEAQRLRYKPRIALATTPSTDEKHYVHTQLLPKLEAAHAVARYTIYDNPFLTLDDIDKIKNRVTSETFDREFLALITRSTEATVLPEFGELKHVSKLTPPSYANWNLVIDQGGIKDPTAITLNYWDYRTKKFCTYRETVLPINSGLDEIIAAAKALETHKTQGPINKFADAMGQVHIEYALKGYPLIQPSKGPGSFDASIQSFRVALQNNEYAVDESCTETIRQMVSGRFNKQRTDFDRDSYGHLDCVASVVLYAYKNRIESDPTPRDQPYSGWAHQSYQKPIDEIALSYQQLIGNIHNDE